MKNVTINVAAQDYFNQVVLPEVLETWEQGLKQEIAEMEEEVVEARKLLVGKEGKFLDALNASIEDMKVAISKGAIALSASKQEAMWIYQNFHNELYNLSFMLSRVVVQHEEKTVA